VRYVLVGSRTGRRRAMSFSRENCLGKLYQVVSGKGEGYRQTRSGQKRSIAEATG